ncbi:hypothetical protein RCL1_005583 [Eukaryota sp. TZLM3-RCL]
MPSLQDILNQSKAIANSLGADDLPNVYSTLDHFATPVAPSPTAELQQNTQFIFARQGIDTASLSRSIESIPSQTFPSTAVAISRPTPVNVSDFLKQRREDAILNALDHTKDSLHDSFVKFVDQVTVDNWMAHHSTLLDAMGATRPTPLVSSTHFTPTATTLTPTPTPLQIPRAPPLREQLLSQVVEKHVFDINEILRNIVRATGNCRNNNIELSLHQAWDLISFYLLEFNRDTADTNKYFREKAIKYLENQFKIFQSKQLTSRDQSIYQGLYNLIRMGNVEGAINLIDSQLRQRPHDSVLSQISRVVIPILRQEGLYHVTFDQSRLLHETLTQISQSTHSDPYLEVVLLSLSGNQPLKTPTIACSTVEDFMWYKLMVADRLIDVDIQKYSISDVGGLITKYGVNHFCPDGKNFILFFNLLLFVQDFKAAFNYLYDIDPLCHCDVSYMMTFTAHYNLIEIDEPKISSYFSNFTPTSPKNLIYLSYYLPRETAVSLLQNFVKYFTSEHFELLKNVLSPEISDMILTRASSRAHEVGDELSMIKLLELTGKFDLIVYNIFERLSSTLSRLPETLLPQEIDSRNKLITTGTEFLQKYDRILIEKVASRDLSLLQLLLSIGNFYSYLQAKRFDDAMAIAKSIPILPLNGNVENTVSLFRSLPNESKRIISPLLMSMIELLSAVRSRETKIMAQYLVTFATKIPFDLPNEVTSSLARLEVSL